MKIYKNYYAGDTAKKSVRKIIRGLEKKDLQPGVYVITLPEGDNNVLEIIPAFVLKYPFFLERRRKLQIVGVAQGRTEAVMLTAKIVQDTYNTTGGFDVECFMAEHKK